MRKIASIQADIQRSTEAIQRNLAASKAEDRALTADEKATHDKLLAELKALNTELEAARECEAELAKAMAHIAVQPASERPASAEPLTEVTSNRQKGEMAARIVRSLVGNPENPVEFAKSVLRDPEVAGVVKAMETGTGSAGGFIIPENYSGEVIELLRAKIAVARAGARVVPMPTGTITIPGLASGATATYEGENEGPSASQPTLRQVQLTARKLTAIVPFSNELLASSSPRVDQLVIEDLTREIAVKTDAAFLLGDGTNGYPKGLYHWSTSIQAANGTANLANVTADLNSKCLLALAQANVPMTNCGWIMAPRLRYFLQALRDTNGTPAFPEVRDGRLLGHPIYETTTMPIDATPSTNEGLLLFVDFSQVLVGETQGLEIAVSKEASYVESGTVKSAFHRNQTVVRAITRHDLGVRHVAAVTGLNTVKWGAS